MITKGDWRSFLTLHGENLLLVKRKHPFVVISPILLTSILTVFFIVVSFFLFTQVIFSIPLFIVTTLLLSSIGVSLVTKCIIDWYFHMYILTTRKILEIKYTPLSSYVMNDIMLDRVNCTEIDFRKRGILNELLDMGDVVITFDRPTNQEEFVLRDIESCHKLGQFLTRKLMDREVQNSEQTIWLRQHAALPN